jgi:hypothetical protein
MVGSLDKTKLGGYAIAIVANSHSPAIGANLNCTLQCSIRPDQSKLHPPLVRTDLSLAGFSRCCRNSHSAIPFEDDTTWRGYRLARCTGISHSTIGHGPPASFPQYRAPRLDLRKTHLAGSPTSASAEEPTSSTRYNISRTLDWPIAHHRGSSEGTGETDVEAYTAAT